MTLHRVLTRSFVNESLCEPGEVIDYGGIPSFNLEPLNADDAEEWRLTTADPAQVALEPSKSPASVPMVGQRLADRS